MIYFTADLHFGHKLMAKMRNFDYISKMNETIIKNWNNVVSSEDEVMLIGDVSLCSPAKTKELIDQLNGKIFLIKGNHEKSAMHKLCISRFEWVRDYYELKHEGDLFVLCHYAFRVWNKSHYGSYHLYGHSHGSLMDDPNAKSMDVGIDSSYTKFMPISLPEVKEILDKKKFKSIDHHVNR